ncbi:MAG: alpha-galactosidase [Clostridia bacterium]|nr:alpha-galactosidase [Clostridia bacterium]
MKRDYSSKKSDASYYSSLSDLSSFPFAFSYDGVRYEGFKRSDMLPVGRFQRVEDNKIVNVFVFTLGGLHIGLHHTYYKSHGVTEWFVGFDNRGDADTKVLESCECIADIDGADPVLSGIYGDHDMWYEPYEFDLCKEDVSFRSEHGRATHITFPYFDLTCGDGGVMLAIGWAGTWSAAFEKTETGVKYTANSVNGLKTYLKPGESIRTASFLFAPYRNKDPYYRTNFWRSFFTECIMPKADASGKALQPFSTCCLASDTCRPNSDGSISEGYDTWKRSLDKMIEEDVKVDFRWLDAGWYQRPDLGSAEPYVPGKDWWDTVGTWVPDPAKWPGDTLLQSTEYARRNGMKTLMWFEPERISDPDNMVKNFGYKREWAIVREGVAAVSNNIGDPECLDYTTKRICKTLLDNKVEMYREDNNSDPAVLWAYLDEQSGENRRGITECKFIQGHYEMWDRIIACTTSFGGCGFVDSCASGGGRNDLESMKRGVPLLRSDFDRTATSIRLSMTSSFCKWIPFCGTNTKEKLSQLAPTGNSDPYIWRASYLPALNVDSQFYADPDQDFSVLRNGLNEWKKVNPYLLKEFYVLTPYHKINDTTGFTAYAYYDPEAEKGVLLAFRQENCADTSLTVNLPFADRKYTLTDEDTKEEYKTDGSLTLRFDQPRTAKLLWIK